MSATIETDSQTHSTSDTSSDASSSNSSKLTQTDKIEKWLSKRNKNEILFLLSSTAGQLATIYDQFGSITRPIRISMDGKYLVMGEQTILLDKETVDISLGISTSTARKHGADNLSPKNNVGFLEMTNEELEDYVYSSLNLTSDYYDFDEVNERYTRRQLIASTLENAANMNEHIESKHCITLHVKNDGSHRHVVLEFVNVTQKYLWAKGISKLISSKKRHRKYRCKAISYILEKYSSTVKHHALMATKHTSEEISTEAIEYFRKKRQYGSLMHKYIFIKSFQKHENNLYNDEITTDLMPVSTNNMGRCLDQVKLFWNSLFDDECKHVRKLPKKYAVLYRRRSNRNGTPLTG